jgi:hypothetical protein
MPVAVYDVTVVKHLFLKGIKHTLWIVVSSSVLSTDILVLKKKKKFLLIRIFPKTVSKEIMCR